MTRSELLLATVGKAVHNAMKFHHNKSLSEKIVKFLTTLNLNLCISPNIYICI
jgi:hypothetical protein